MNSKELRKNFLNFFEKRGHVIVPSSSLLPEDPTVLFTTAGMQQFKEYYLGKPSPYGKRVTSCQKCFRTSDIEEVGDTKHLTFLEMLGNFSFAVSADFVGRRRLRRPKAEASGRRRSLAMATEREGGDGYFKKEAIEFALELLTKDFKIPIEKLWFTYFKGEKNIPQDQESLKILKDLAIPKERIQKFGKEDNFWGPTGQEGPCGPTVEIHYDLTGKPCQKGKKCLPNCECGRFVELWNLVFNEYYQNRNGKFTLLKQKGVDTGMGLERLAMICQEKFSVYETDLFSPIISEIKKMMKLKEIKGASSFDRLYRPPIAFEVDKEKFFQEAQNLKSLRIVADHIKAAVFLASEGIFPSNIERGYVLRRILRRLIRFGKLLTQPSGALRAGFLIPLAKKVIEIYQDIYPEVKLRETEILTIIQKEEEKFARTLERGLRQFEKISIKGEIKGEEAFHLFDTYGFPLELTKELAREKGIKVDILGFEKAFERHREISRAGAEKKFGGIGREAGYENTKLHTATHLLHQALREVLGGHVKQMGSDINPKRLRFDFSHPQRLTEKEIKKVEDLVNQKIKEDLEVKKEEMPLKEAIKSGALAFFKEKYPEMVTVYSIGNFSKEICAGPHVRKTSELGKFKIIKEESSGAGIRRIRAILE